MRNSAKEFEDDIDLSEAAFKKRFRRISPEELPTVVKKIRQTVERDTKSRVTIYFDSDILSRFKEMSKKEGVGYQTLMNLALRRVVDGMAEKDSANDFKNDILRDKKFLKRLKTALS